MAVDSPVQPVPRTIEQPVKIAFLDASDWLVLLSAILLPRLLESFFRRLTVFGISYQQILEVGAIVFAVVLLKTMKFGKPRGHLVYSLIYWLRPNRYS
jgi:hypothetical protein